MSEVVRTRGLGHLEGRGTYSSKQVTHSKASFDVPLKGSTRAPSRLTTI